MRLDKPTILNVLAIVAFVATSLFYVGFMRLTDTISEGDEIPVDGEAMAYGIIAAILLAFAILIQLRHLRKADRVSLFWQSLSTIIYGVLLLPVIDRVWRATSFEKVVLSILMLSRGELGWSRPPWYSQRMMELVIDLLSGAGLLLSWAVFIWRIRAAKSEKVLIPDSF